MVLSRRALSDWGKEHVRQFMIQNGYPEPDDSELNVIQARLKAGWSFEKILSVMAVLALKPG